MAAKLTRLTHKIALNLHLVAAIPFAVLAPGGQSGNGYTHVIVVIYVQYNPIFTRNKSGLIELTPRSRVLFVKLIVTQLVNKFPFFYETCKFITVFTRTLHWTLS
jgi:hypothetical protein